MACASRPAGECVRSKNRPFADPEPAGNQRVVLKFSRARTVGSIASSPTTDPEARSLIVSTTRWLDSLTVVVKNGLWLRHALNVLTPGPWPSLATNRLIATAATRVAIASAEMILRRHAPSIGMLEAHLPK